MRKFTIILSILLLISCCGCNNADTVSRNDVVINMPADNTVNGYRNENDIGTNNDTSANNSKIESSKPTENNVIQYCANINSKKFHLPDCGSAKTIKEENRLYLSDRAELISLGYEPCKRCNP